MSQTKVEAPFVEGGGGTNFKNLLINGDYQIWQRGTSAATVTASNSAGTYMSDRWASWEYNDGTITQEQSALDNDDFETTGMRNALLVKCTGTDSSIAADQFAMITQVIEAQNCQGLKWGTDNAKDVTLSFWVKSNLTGTFTATLRKPDTTYYYIPKEYTISSANTWEKKTITYGPDDTNGSVLKASTGNIVNDNGEGIWVQFGLAFGSNFHGTAGTWANALTGISTSNQTNFMSSTSNNFYLTGVQLEAGNDASDFEHLPFDVSLIRCQRYFEVMVDGRSVGSGTLSSGDSDEDFPGTGINHNTQYAYMPLKFATTKRSNAPSLLTTNDTNHFRLYSNNTNDQLSTVFNAGTSSHHNLTIYFDYGSTNGWTQGHAAFARCNNANAYVMVKDEL